VAAVNDPAFSRCPSVLTFNGSAIDLPFTLPTSHHTMRNIDREQVVICLRLLRQAAKGSVRASPVTLGLPGRDRCRQRPPYSDRAVHKAELLEQGKGPMADRHALKLIGIMFAALTLMVISTAAVVVAGHATGFSGEYSELAGSRD
jgi:hypothetical protein